MQPVLSADNCGPQQECCDPQQEESEVKTDKSPPLDVPSKIDLKPLPSNLRYEFLDSAKTPPVINNIPIDDSIPGEQLYAIETHYGDMQPPFPGENSSAIAACNLRPPHGQPILQMPQNAGSSKMTPWYADIVNFLAANILPTGMTYQQRKNFKWDVKSYIWEEPYLFKIGVDGIFRRCVPHEEVHSILSHCHSSAYGGHASASETADKVFQSGFYWPTVFKDAQILVQSCNQCQRTGNITKRHEKPQHLSSSFFPASSLPFFSSCRNFLRCRNFLSTPIIDFEFLDHIGIAEEFLRITERVGFSKNFWDIPRDQIAYEEPTREFLASLSLVQISRSIPGIQFKLCGVERRTSIQQLRRWFYLSHCDTDYLGYIPESEVRDVDPIHESVHRHNFWLRLTNESLLDSNPDATITAIIHPVLRFTCRALGMSVFARGETTYRPIHSVLALLATILRRDDQLQRPNLMLHMVKHWMSIANTSMETGLVVMGSYVTHIAHCMGIDLSQTDYTPLPPGVPTIKRQFQNWRWIKVIKRRGRESLIKWKVGHQEFPMPMQLPPIDPIQPMTWKIPQGAVPHAPPQDFDIHMEDIQEHAKLHIPPHVRQLRRHHPQQGRRLSDFHDMMHSLHRLRIDNKQ